MHDVASMAAAGLAGADLEREFEDRLAECSTLAFRVAYAVLRHRQDAEDVAQDAFVRAHRSYHRLRDRSRFRAWLVKTAWRLAIDRWRANRRRSSREQRSEVHAAPLSAAEVAEANARAERLWHAIDTLAEPLRAAIVLAGIEGHDIREVAALLELPEGTVKSRLFAARQQIKAHLLSSGEGERHG